MSDASLERDTSLFLIYILIYFAMFFVSFFLLRQFSKFDTIYGFIAYMRTKDYTSAKIKWLLTLYLFWLFGVPLIFAITWGLNMTRKEEVDSVQAVSVTMTVVVSSLTLLSFSSWYGGKWHLSRFVGVLLILSCLAGWGFALTILLLPEYFSYSGTSAIMFSTNFLPAVYIIYKKNLNKDIPL